MSASEAGCAEAVGDRSKRRRIIPARHFPTYPYHFRWECKDPKVSWESNDRACPFCVCYMCNVTMKSCRVHSHRWAAPESVCQWDCKRGAPSAVKVVKRPPVDIAIVGDAVKVATVTLPIRDIGSTIDSFGVPSAMVRMYMQTPCVDALWPMLKSLDLRSQAHIAGKIDEFNAIDEACIGTKADRTLVGKMITVSKVEINPRRHSLAILQLENAEGSSTRVILKADLYITRSAKCARSREILKMSDSTPLIEPNVSNVDFPPVLDGQRACFEHQRISLGHMLHIEEHGLTHRLWTASCNDDVVCMMNDMLGSTHLLKRSFNKDELPDRSCVGGLLCNDRGTGKTLVACGLVAFRRPPEEWLESTAGIRLNNAVQIATNIDSDDDDSDDDFEDERPWLSNGRARHLRAQLLDSFEDEIQLRNAEQCPRVATTLIILPSHNLIAQWVEELESVGLSVGVRHGARRMDTVADIAKHDAVVTTALTLSKDFDDSAFAQVRFWRVIVDEIHKILATAKLSGQARTVLKLRARHRWGITATPDTRGNMLRLYMRFLYGIPDIESAALNHVHHYMRFASYYRSVNAAERVFFPAMSVQVPAQMARPPVHHHVVSVEADGAWMERYQEVYRRCKQHVRYMTGLGEQRVVNQLLMAIGGAKAMPMPGDRVSDEMLGAVESDVQVPPDIVDCSICLQDLCRPVVTQCNHYFCEGCLAIWHRTQPYPRCPICRGGIDAATIQRCAVLAQQEQHQESCESELPPCQIKIDMIAILIRQLLDADATARILVFSRFPAVREAIREAMGSSIRHTKSIKRFQSNSELSVLILSPTSCAVGLNLTQANHVILSEPAFKLATEKQAYARADRIGQTREVHVHQFHVAKTIEENIVKMRRRDGGESFSVASYAFSS